MQDRHHRTEVCVPIGGESVPPSRRFLVERELDTLYENDDILWVGTKHGVLPVHAGWYGKAREMWLSGEYEWRVDGKHAFGR